VLELFESHLWAVRLPKRYALSEESEHNPGFSLGETVIRFFGVSGGSVQRNRRQAICQVLDGPRGVHRLELDILCVHLDENDVRRMESRALLKNYFDFCDQSSSINSVRVIVVCDMLLFPVLARNARLSRVFESLQ
jgi:hypothetical protein